MHTMSQAEFLALWETGRSLHPLDQGVLAVQAAFPEFQESIADWPLGRRNRALVELLRSMFGSSLRGWTTCRECNEQLEFELDCETLAASNVPASHQKVAVGGLSYRLPTTRDLAAVAVEHDAKAAARLLLQRCGGTDSGPDGKWTEEYIESVGQCLAAADPLAEVLLTFDCPGCGAAFDECLDLPSFLWAEMEAAAKRILLSVHTLASAYGWSEKEVLSLSPARRETYLEMVRA